MGGERLNDFKECLEYSLGEREQFDEKILKQHFPWVEEVIKTDTETDKTGIDYIAKSKDGSSFTIDAKTRMPGCSKYWKDNTPELCLEGHSDCEKGIAGWLFKNSVNHPDYILYTFSRKDTNRYYLVPFQLLKKATYQHAEQWKLKYGIKYQKNKGGWTSSAIFVPAPEVLTAINELMKGEIS